MGVVRRLIRKGVELSEEQVAQLAVACHEALLAYR